MFGPVTLVNPAGGIPMKTRRLYAVALLTLLALTQTFTGASAQSEAQPPLPTVTLVINSHELTAEVAQRIGQRYMGLSFRTELAPNAGMLFVYPAEQMLTFTMRNTKIPLTIAYISKDWVINEFHDMPVGPNQLFPSSKPAQYALEVNQGWFKSKGIAVGDRLTVR